jgi:excisionase family DNA binding protein
MSTASHGLAALDTYLRGVLADALGILRAQLVNEITEAMKPSHVNGSPVSMETRASLLGVGEVAALLGVTPATVREYIKSGRLEASRVPGGRNWRIERQAVTCMLSRATPSEARSVDDRVEGVLRRLR